MKLKLFFFCLSVTAFAVFHAAPIGAQDKFIDLFADDFPDDVADNVASEDVAIEESQRPPETLNSVNTVPNFVNQTLPIVPPANPPENPPANPPENLPNPAPIPQNFQCPLPLISNFQAGMYYIQIGSYANIDNVYNEVANNNRSFPVAVMRATLITNGMEKDVYRVLIGPLNYSESRTLLQQLSVKYRDAFVWTGR